MNWEAFKSSSGEAAKATILVLNAVTFDANGNKLKTMKCPALQANNKGKDKQTFELDILELAGEEGFDSIWFFATTFLPMQTFNGVENVKCSLYCN